MGHPTKDRLLDAAESLFAERGIRETSMRAITERAEANLAAVNYHFGSKEGLIRAVLDRRLVPLNAERIELLDGLAEATGESGPTVEGILYALVAPAFQLGREESHDFAALLGRLHFEQDETITALLVDSFSEVLERFLAALHQALPDLTPRQLIYRLHFAIGSMAMIVVNHHVLEKASRGLVQSLDTENVIRRLINFLAHGFRAEPVSAELELSELSAKSKDPS